MAEHARERRGESAAKIPAKPPEKIGEEARD